MARQVSCTEKDRAADLPSQVRAIGGTRKEGNTWVRWRKTQAAAIAEIEAGEQTYYVNITGSAPNLVVATHNGIKYLKAPADKDAPTTLLSLPDCEAER